MNAVVAKAVMPRSNLQPAPASPRRPHAIPRLNPAFTSNVGDIFLFYQIPLILANTGTFMPLNVFTPLQPSNEPIET